MIIADTRTQCLLRKVLVLFGFRMKTDIYVKINWKYELSISMSYFGQRGKANALTVVIGILTFNQNSLSNEAISEQCASETAGEFWRQTAFEQAGCRFLIAAWELGRLGSRRSWKWNGVDQARLAVLDNLERGIALTVVRRSSTRICSGISVKVLIFLRIVFREVKKQVNLRGLSPFWPNWGNQRKL